MPRVRTGQNRQNQEEKRPRDGSSLLQPASEVRIGHGPQEGVGVEPPVTVIAIGDFGGGGGPGDGPSRLLHHLERGFREVRDRLMVQQ